MINSPTPACVAMSSDIHGGDRTAAASSGLTARALSPRAAALALLLGLGILLSCALPAASLALTPTPRWAEQSTAQSPSDRWGSSMAFDPGTGQMVLFGGVEQGGTRSDETFTYNGTSWTTQSTAQSPSGRSGASMAYDPATGQMVLFGGQESGGGASGETFTYDGTTWTKSSLAESPSERDEAAMAFDPETGQMVLFGGADGNTSFNDTWTYNGSTWTKQAIAESPPALAGGTMAYDPATGQMVLFGENALGGLSSESWTYNGSTWTKLSLSHAPSSGSSSSMAYDSATAQMVLFGGSNGLTLSDETFAYNGRTWTQQAATESPSGRFGASMAFDPATGQMVLFGGFTADGYSDETWTYAFPAGTPATWTKLETPPPREKATMAFDASTGKVVLFGGDVPDGPHEDEYSNDTWTYNGTTWTQQHTPQSPPAGGGEAMAYDPSTGQILLYRQNESDELWAYNGVTWSQQSGPEVPAVFQGANMAYDSATGQMVLFGFSGISEQTSETWTYNGSSWTKQSPSDSPSPRAIAAMAYDPTTGQMVLFGGEANDERLIDETWTFNGTTWTKQSTPESPPALAGAMIAFDPTTGKLVLFGGSTVSGHSNQTWTYDGTTWRKQSTAESPAGRTFATMAYDSATGQMVLFGGGTEGGLNQETWIYDGTNWNQGGSGDAPSPRWDDAIAFDPALNEVVLFGGFGSHSAADTWTYNGTRWTEQSPAESPPAAGGASIAFDPVTHELVLFGGEDEYNYKHETWTYNGVTWTEQSTAESPPGVVDARMDFDPATGEMILLGGYNGYRWLNDTWTYNGTTWTKQSPAESPELGAGGMAYDPATAQMVAVGKDGSITQTWEYDGTTWSQPASAETPSAEEGATLAFDPAIGRMILFGVLNGEQGEVTGTYDGTRWTTEEKTEGNPRGETGGSMVFDPASGQLVRFGGDVGGGNGSNETWTYQPSSKVAPELSTSASAGVATGGSVHDSATISGGSFPSGTLTFKLYGPSDTGCTGTPVFTAHAVALTGDGEYESAAYVAPAPGTYRWVASYSGDPDNEAREGACGEAGESVTVVKASAALSTAASAGVTPGGKVHDTATISGGYTPSGTVTFKLYGPSDTGCTMTPVYTSAAVTVTGDGAYESSEYAPSVLGSYRWVAVYSGDSNNEAQEGACGEAGESVTLKAATSLSTSASASVAVGSTVHDSAVLSGGSSPSGTMTFKLYDPSDTGCTGTPVFTSSGVAVSGNGTYESDPYIPVAPGTYRWIASYSGDSVNEVREGACGEAGESVTVVKASPALSTAASAGIGLGGKVYDTATISGGYSPSGTVTFKLYGPASAGCTGIPLYTSPPVTVTGDGAYESAEYPPAALGAYDWVASYSGDSNNQAQEGTCAESGESVTIVKAMPALQTSASAAVAVGGTVHDSATLSGGVSPSGAIVFKLYRPSDPGCSGSPVASSAVTVSGDGTYESGEYAPVAPGSYRWVASYSGDSNNEAKAGACGEAGESVTVTEAPTTPTSTSSTTTSTSSTTPVSNCPQPSGRLAHTSLGALELGFTRARARSTLRGRSASKGGSDDFCLSGGAGISAGYPTASLLRRLPAGVRVRVRGTVVLLLTANRYYALRGARPGMAFAAVSTQLTATKAYQAHGESWYVVAGARANGVLLVRKGRILCVGIAERLLTNGRRQLALFG
jgi:hypothetical protein